MSHADDCARGHHRAAIRKANDPLSDRLRDRLILDAIERCESAPDQLRSMLDQARADLADGVIDERGRIVWAY